MSEYDALEAGLPHLEQFMKLLEVSRSESDRGAVLIHAQMLDELLKLSIEGRLVDHKEVRKLTDGFNAPIGTFSSRTLLALALGVISEREYTELKFIRKIRNKFAHSIEMSFANESVSSQCALLTYAAQDYGEVRLDARGKFLTAGTSLVLNLVNRPFYVAEQRLAQQTSGLLLSTLLQ